MIGIIDYGAGNLKSVYSAFRYLGEEVKVCTDPEELFSADKIVLPGVGATRDALNGLGDKKFIPVIMEQINKGKYFLGICLGLQMLFTYSEENNGCECLDIIKGKVRLFPGGEALKVPHMGWNTVKFTKDDCPIFKGITDESYFYFVHSYYCDNDENEYTAGMTDYGVRFTSAVWKDNMFALQFHPERSQENGIKILENFIKL